MKNLLLLFALFVSPTQAEETIVMCKSGFVPGNNERQVIPQDRINDGYCDCPLDGGQDETHTEACSGSSIGGWAGVVIDTSQQRQPQAVYTCPQQPNLVLPVSRLHDGICDCCDGSDEDASSATCPDICDEVLAEEREERRTRMEHYQVGSARRTQELVAFQSMLRETSIQLESVEKEHASVTTQLEQMEIEINALKKDFLQQRHQLVQDTIASVANQGSLLEPLSNPELMQVIVQACQLAGEYSNDGDNKEFTCVPLRLAGVDLGLMWDDEDFQQGTVSLQRWDLEDSWTEWADVVDRNAVGNNFVWSTNKKTNTARRRLTSEEEEEKDEPAEYDNYHEEDFYNDDIDYRYDHENDEYNDGERHDEMYDENVPTYNRPENTNDELYNEVKRMAFSATRVSFLTRSSELIGKIDELMQDTDAQDENEEAEEPKPPETTAVDPMAFQMVRSNLRRREEAIQRGLDYAVSANILIKTVQESRQDLITLAAGTLYHGKISSVDFWQIVAYLNVEIDPKDHSCVSPWSVLCPPQQTQRGKTLYPPKPFILAAEELCRELDTSVDVCSGSGEEIPTSIPERYYGYMVPKPRGNDDFLGMAFAPLDTVVDRSTLEKLVEARDELKDKQTSLSKNMKDLEEQMGGRDHSKFGYQGELYALRDSCNSVQQGKYVYEVCMFGRATQKDVDSHSPTQLGSWSKMRFNQKTGERVLEWTNGAQCWNGPKRSATVHVTCGPETKLLSAEEPDTCRYVLEMESYIACDDHYRQRHDI